MLYNYSCHANAFDTSIFNLSWNWPGFTSQQIKNEIKCEALFLPNACGNVHPLINTRTISHLISTKIIKCLQNSKTIVNDNIQFYHKTITLFTRNFDDINEQMIEQLCNSNFISHFKNVLLSRLNFLKTKTKQTISIKLDALVIGHDIIIVFVPGELFVEYGLLIKQNSPFLYTIIVESLIYDIGYLPLPKIYEKVSYQTLFTILDKNSVELFVTETINLIKKIHNERP